MTDDTDGRRKLLKALGATAVLATWKTPKVDAVTIPEHAQASPPPPPPPECVPRDELTRVEQHNYCPEPEDE